MSDVREHPSSAQVGRLGLRADPCYLSALADWIRAMAAAAGSLELPADELTAVVERIGTNIIINGYGGDTTQQLDVELAMRCGSFVVTFHDRGEPFDFDKLGDDPTLAEQIRGLFDGIELTAGVEGNRVELTRHVPRGHVAEHAHEDLGPADEPPAPEDEEIIYRRLRADEASQLSRMMYRTYGYSYPARFVYYPDEVVAALRHGTLLSVVAENSAGELVGHLGLTYEQPGAAVGESGQAVVDPRYRGHGLFKNLKRYARDEAAGQGTLGIFSEAVTQHPYSQKGNISLGAHEVGFLLGYSPGSMEMKGIEGQERGQPRRQSVALMYWPVNEPKQAEVRVPDSYRDLVVSLYERLELPRRVSGGFEDKLPAGRGHIIARINPDLNQAFIRVRSPGIETIDHIAKLVTRLRRDRTDCIYVDLPCERPGAAALAERLRDHGFFFGGVLPHLGGGDVLRMQSLTDVTIDVADVHTASEAGAALLAAVAADFKRAEAARDD